MKQPEAIYIGNYKSGSTFIRSYFKQHPDLHFHRCLWYFQCEGDDEVRQKTYFDWLSDAPDGLVLIDMFESLTLPYTLVNPPPLDPARKHIAHHWQPELFMNPDVANDGSVITPGHEETIRRLKATIPDVKIILGLRNQPEWLLSCYTHYIGYFPPERASFTDFASTLEGKATLSAGFYDQILDAYFDAFGREKVFVFLLEELALQQDWVLQSLCSFLGVPFVEMDNTKANYNRVASSNMNIVTNIFSASQEPVAQENNPFWKRIWPRSKIALQTAPEDRKHFPQEIRGLIDSMYGYSNLRSSRLLAKNLQAYGYPL